MNELQELKAKNARQLDVITNLSAALKLARDNIWDNWRPNTPSSARRRDEMINKLDTTLAKAEGRANG